jgi:hypothetical protein
MIKKNPNGVVRDNAHNVFTDARQKAHHGRASQLFDLFDQRNALA